MLPNGKLLSRAAGLIHWRAWNLLGQVQARVTEEVRARRYYVSGIVQGVGYRYFAERTAARLYLAGYAKNLRDGRVEVYAIGPAKSLDALRVELERGPRSASVTGVAEEEAPVEARFANEFSIEYES
jgi:acylphosphatase